MSRAIEQPRKILVLEARTAHAEINHLINELKMDSTTADGLARIEAAKAAPVRALVFPLVGLGAVLVIAIVFVVLMSGRLNPWVAGVGVIALAMLGWPIYKSLQPLLAAAVKKLTS